MKRLNRSAFKEKTIRHRLIENLCVCLLGVMVITACQSSENAKENEDTVDVSLDTVEQTPDSVVHEPLYYMVAGETPNDFAERILGAERDWLFAIIGDFGKSEQAILCVYADDRTYQTIALIKDPVEQHYEFITLPEDENREDFLSFPIFNCHSFMLYDVDGDGLNELLCLIHVTGKGGAMEDGTRHEYDDPYLIIYSYEDGEFNFLDPQDLSLDMVTTAHELKIKLGIIKFEQEITNPEDMVNYLIENDHLARYENVIDGRSGLLRYHESCPRSSISIEEDCGSECEDDPRPFAWLNLMQDGTGFFIDTIRINDSGSEVILFLVDIYEGNRVQWAIQQRDGLEYISVINAYSDETGIYVHDCCIEELEESDEICEEEY
ncbi:MAG: hypothetical protein IIA45_06800 [Bacteroidetes bacterium]|nr:hypothetical protein [Bacteroidota bacterium]